MSRANAGDIIIAGVGNVVLRGVTVALDTEVGQQFIVDCARNIEGQMPDSEVKTKYELSDADWERLADNRPLLQAVRAERERRILSGETAREGRCSISPRHQTSSTAFWLTNRYHRVTGSKLHENYAKLRPPERKFRQSPRKRSPSTSTLARIAK